MSQLNPLSVKKALEYIESHLDSDEASDDARYLLSFVLNKNFTWLHTWPDKVLTQEQQQQLEQVTSRRKGGEPIAYITGERDFWTLTFKTNSSTLIPRPETELLVERGIEFLVQRQSQFSSQSILDLGTGTGAIGLSIASERPQDKVTAVDFHSGAVALARENAVLNQVNNVEIFQSDWFESINNEKSGSTQFDLIVSNPPYVEENDQHLLQGDLVFEPNSALISSGDGLADIRLIIKRASAYLLNNGMLMIEHGFEQGLQVRDIFIEQGYSQVKTIKDLAGLDRITMGQANVNG